MLSAAVRAVSMQTTAFALCCSCCRYIASASLSDPFRSSNGKAIALDSNTRTKTQQLSPREHGTPLRSYERRHSERSIVPFTQAEVFDVVADIDRYQEFIPWCTKSKVTAIVDGSHMIADLSVGFKLLSESYTSVVTLDRPKSVLVDVPESSLFDYLINDWHFEKGDSPSTTLLDFNVRFAFRISLYRHVTDIFFEEVAKQMVTAFKKRCYVLYKPVPRRRGMLHRW